jgi:hypothetical protein
MQGVHQIDRRPRGGDFAFWLRLLALMAFWGGPTKHHRHMGGTPASLDSEDALLDEIRQTYKGRVAIGHDLDIF